MSGIQGLVRWQNCRIYEWTVHNTAMITWHTDDDSNNDDDNYHQQLTVKMAEWQSWAKWASKLPWGQKMPPTPILLPHLIPSVSPPLPRLGSHQHSFQPPGGTKLSEVRGTLWLDKMLQNDSDNNDNEFHVSQSWSHGCLAELTHPIKLLQVQREIRLIIPHSFGILAQRKPHLMLHRCTTWGNISSKSIKVRIITLSRRRSGISQLSLWEHVHAICVYGLWQSVKHFVPNNVCKDYIFYG